MLTPKAASVLKFAMALHKARPDVDSPAAMHIAMNSHVEHAHLTPEDAVALYVIAMPPNADDATGDA
jgi:hypothetical protein